MLGIFGRKKIGEDKLSKIFINAMWKMSSEAFNEIAEMINEDPEFVSSPNIDPNSQTNFFFIIISGNLKYLPHRLAGSHSKFIIMKIYNQIAEMFDTSSGSIEKHIKHLQSEMSRLNHPSKNTLYAMSKLFFKQYDLYQYQDEYYSSIQAPNPIVLKRLDAIMSSFLWDWDAFSDEYKIVD